MSDSQNTNIVRWSSDGKIPFERCVEDIHVYECTGSSENAICECGKTKWVFETCSHCNEKRGKAVELNV